MNTTLLEIAILLNYAIKNRYGYLSPVRAYCKLCNTTQVFNVYTGITHVSTGYPMFCDVSKTSALGKYLMRHKLLPSYLRTTEG